MDLVASSKIGNLANFGYEVEFEMDRGLLKGKHLTTK